MSNPLGGRGDDAGRRPVRRPLKDPVLLAAQQVADELRFCTDALDLVVANRTVILSHLPEDGIRRVQLHDVLTQWTTGAIADRGTVWFEGFAAQFDQRIEALGRTIDDLRASLALTATLLLGDVSAIDRARFFQEALALLVPDLRTLRAMRPSVPAPASVQLHRVETVWSLGGSADGGTETLTGDRALFLTRLTACDALMRDLLLRIERLTPADGDRPTTHVDFPEDSTRLRDDPMR